MAVDQKREAIIQDLKDISAHFYEYLRTPPTLGGGAGSDEHYQLPNGNVPGVVIRFFLLRLASFCILKNNWGS